MIKFSVAGDDNLQMWSERTMDFVRFAGNARDMAIVIDGMGTIVALMLPYTVVLMVLWTLMLVIWSVLGIPLGPS